MILNYIYIIFIIFILYNKSCQFHLVNTALALKTFKNFVKPSAEELCNAITYRISIFI